MKFLILAIVSCSCALCLAQNNDRIIKGANAKRRQFPYIVSLHCNGQHVCGGSIVSKTWVISAGHCFAYFAYELKWEVIAGMLNQNETHPDNQRAGVSAIVLHPDFIRLNSLEGSNLDNDIALAKLSSPLIFTEAVKPVSLPKPNQEFSGKAWISGWGRTSTFNQSVPITLQCLEMNVVTNKECIEILSNTPTIHYPFRDSMVCTVPLAENNRSSGCHGDSGGPLVQKGTLIGIVSFGDASCGPRSNIITNVFTRVSNYISFIHSVVHDI